MRTLALPRLFRWHTPDLAPRPAGISPLPDLKVDLPRYLGRWYVLASIAPRVERAAHNAVEYYQAGSRDRVKTVFTFRRGSFDARLRTIKSTAKVVSAGGSAWRVRFWPWPLRFEYRIAWLSPDYDQVIVARSRRDFVWLMARTPTVPAADYSALLQRAAALGYDAARLRKVPQRWPDTGP